MDDRFGFFYAVRCDVHERQLWAESRLGQKGRKVVGQFHLSIPVLALIRMDTP
jgi:hypothetical protein